MSSGSIFFPSEKLFGLRAEPDLQPLFFDFWFTSSSILFPRRLFGGLRAETDLASCQRATEHLFFLRASLAGSQRTPSQMISTSDYITLSSPLVSASIQWSLRSSDPFSPRPMRCDAVFVAAGFEPPNTFFTTSSSIIFSAHPLSEPRNPLSSINAEDVSFMDSIAAFFRSLKARCPVCHTLLPCNCNCGRQFASHPSFSPRPPLQPAFAGLQAVCRGFWALTKHPSFPRSLSERSSRFLPFLPAGE